MKITSPSNDLFKKCLELDKRRGQTKHGLYMVSGEPVVLEYALKFPDEVESILYLSEHKEQMPSLFAEKFKKKHVEFSPELFDKLDMFQTKFPLLLVKLPSLPVWNFEWKGLALLCPLGEASNVGALARSALAFQVDHFVLLKEAASPFLPKAVRAASGALPHLKFYSGPSVLELGAFAPQIHALDMQGENIYSYKWPKNLCLLVGEEGRGIPDAAFQKVSIPMNKNSESLNAMIAASLALFHFRAP